MHAKNFRNGGEIIKMIKSIDLDSVVFMGKALKSIPMDFCLKNKLIPYNIQRGILQVAADRTNKAVNLDELKFIYGGEVEIFYADPDQIFNAINEFYEKGKVNIAIENLSSLYLNDKLKDDLNKNLNINSFPSIDLTDSIINLAIQKNASDIHIEPYEKSAFIRYRVDGILYEILKIPLNIYPLVCTRIKVLANINISEKRLPQDGKITYKSNKQFFDLRVSTLPTIHGEKIVIRILYKSKDLISLNNLGFSEKSVNTIRNILKVSNGIILLTGPTGSGKSTTLYAMLNEIDKVKKNIITIEDPVEYTMEGINQVNVNPKAKLTFAEGLRSILRQDPDVIMVGEIRDEETAQIAIRAAITGHLVLSTLHTNNALDSISRLADMKVPQYLISDALIGIIAQRLIRKLCSSCKEEYLPSVEEKTMLGIDSNTRLFKSRGCAKCSNKGYKGRCVVYEIFTVDDEQRYLIQKGKYGEELKKSYYKGNVFSLKKNCLELIKKGVTSFEEYIRVIYAK